MKKHINIILIIAFGSLCIIATRSAKSDVREAKHREVVIVGYEESLGNVITNQYGSWGPQIGLTTTWTSRSVDAPTIQYGTELGEAIAKLLSDGFGQQPQTVYGELMFVK